MEIWLNHGNQKFRLPVLPSEFEVASSNSNERVSINAIGIINLLGKKGLKELTIATFFPYHAYSFVAYKTFPKPWECVKMIEGWKNSGSPSRLIITGTSVNMEVAIDEFTYGPADGTKDVYFTLSLSEYVRIKQTQNNSSAKKTSAKRPAPSKTTAGKKHYIVKKGDTLTAIAKKLTGSAANYQKIAKENGIKNPDKLTVGQKLII